MKAINRHWKSSLLVTILITFLVVLWAYKPAQTQGPAVGAAGANATNIKPKTPPAQHPARRELTEKRSADSRTFDNDDGTYTAEIYGGPIHYKGRDGNYRPINTNIRKEPTLPQAGLDAFLSMASAEQPEIFAYAAEENDIRAYFKERADEGNMFRAEVGDYYVSWQPTSMKWVYADGSSETIATVQPSVSSNNGNKVFYADLFPDVDEEIQVLSGKIKDQFILYSPPLFPSRSDAQELSIEGILNVPQGLDFYVDGIKQTENFATSSNIELRNGNSEFVLNLLAPTYNEYFSDNSDVSVGSYYINISSGTILLSMSIPYHWVNDSTRIYPIVIDPTITPNPDTTEDSTIMSGCPSSYRGTQSIVGYDGTGTPACGTGVGCAVGVSFCNERSLDVMIQFAYQPFTSLPSCATITSAYLKVYTEDDSGSGFPIEVQQNSAGWSQGTLIWNNAPAYFPPASNFNYSAGVGWNSWNVTNTVSAWKGSNTLPTRGLRIMDTALSDNWMRFSQNGTANEANLQITYSLQCNPSSDCCSSSGCYSPNGTSCPGGTCNTSGQCILTPCVPPSAPTQPSASATCNSVTLSWSAVTPPTNCTITGYKVFRNSVYLTTISGTTYTDNTVSPNTTYSYHCIAPGF